MTGWLEWTPEETERMDACADLPAEGVPVTDPADECAFCGCYRQDHERGGCTRYFEQGDLGDPDDEGPCDCSGFVEDRTTPGIASATLPSISEARRLPLSRAARTPRTAEPRLPSTASTRRSTVAACAEPGYADAPLPSMTGRGGTERSRGGGSRQAPGASARR